MRENIKSVLACSLAVLLIALAEVQGASSEAKSHNITWGARGQRDLHLQRQILTEKAKTLRIVSNDFVFRLEANQFPYRRTITAIVVTDQYTNGNGGYASLLSGGPNTDAATIHLKSQRGHGYKFIIDIYGQ